MNWKGLAVEIIRVCWDHGYYRGSKWLQQIHGNWFEYWVDYKAEKTMSSIDSQIEAILEPSKVDEPVFTETVEGDTELGGEMRIRSPWNADD